MKKQVTYQTKRSNIRLKWLLHWCKPTQVKKTNLLKSTYQYRIWCLCRWFLVSKLRNIQNCSEFRRQNNTETILSILFSGLRKTGKLLYGTLKQWKYVEISYTSYKLIQLHICKLINHAYYIFLMAFNILMQMRNFFISLI